ncbi:hypothetical protein [Bacillus sp. PS217]|uniref:hypothetical protein n=1 Tax=Bacillus sp. PS217 TaxID=2954722 RepID=UPI0030DBE6F5
MLIKFLRPEHVSAFLDGSLFFMNTGYFIDLEKNDKKNKGIGDKYEGSHFTFFDNETHTVTIEIDGNKHNLPLEKGFMTLTNGSIRKLLLSCFTNIPFNPDNFYQDFCNHEYKIKSEVLEGLEKEFQDRIPIFIKHKPFFERFDTKAKKIGFRRGLVKYFDEYSGYPLKLDQLENVFSDTLFYKRDFFKHQKEYRIVLANPLDLDSTTIELGNLRDCIVQLESVQDLRKLSISFKPTEKHSV